MMPVSRPDVQSYVTKERKRIGNVGFYSSVRNEKFGLHLPVFRAKNVPP